MNITRECYHLVEKYLFKGKEKKRAIIIYGSRQVGKTTLVKQILEKYSEKAEYYNCDYLDVQELFAYKNASKIGKPVKGLKLLILDEAQRIENIGLLLKILIDEYPDLQILATGSSSFDLSNKINEPLTGRKIELKLFPLSFSELTVDKNSVEKQKSIEDILRFGSYPIAALSGEKDAEVFLKELTNSYLFKDILTFQHLKKPEVLTKLLRLLAFQLGNEVSYQELATSLGVDQTVVQKYIHLLEEAFVIFRLAAFSRNLRKELNKSRKIYFYDLGIRNTLIQNFNTLEFRNDIGALWENFCIIERYKALEYKEKTPNRYFWRTYDQKEIDYIEEDSGKLNAYEFKWGKKKKMKPPVEFLNEYKNSKFNIVGKDEFEDFLLKP